MAPPPTLRELIEIVRQDAGSDLPLDQLVAASAAAAQLQETTDALLGHFVDRCRRDGRSWTEISAALGVTKQAVHKRFAPALADQLIGAVPAPTFARFTDRARLVVAQSRKLADRLGSPEVGTEHVLLALYAAPQGLAARALAAMDVSEDAVRAAIGALPASGTQPPAEPPAAGPPYSGDARELLRDTLTVALEFGHNYIGTEHILLGLYRNEGSAAARILTESGALEATARAHVVDMLRGFSTGT
jgi:Clp amino terminal domain, pathogenicity island component